MIAPKEFTTGLQNLGFRLDKDEVTSLLKFFDEDKDAKIDFKEFKKFIEGKKDLKKLEDVHIKNLSSVLRNCYTSMVDCGSVEALWKEFDSNKDGDVSYAEFKRTMPALGFHLTEKELKGLDKELDKDGDGVIKKQEFLKFT
eukprot:UN18370